MTTELMSLGTRYWRGERPLTITGMCLTSQSRRGRFELLLTVAVSWLIRHVLGRNYASTRQPSAL